MPVRWRLLWLIAFAVSISWCGGARDQRRDADPSRSQEYSSAQSAAVGRVGDPSSRASVMAAHTRITRSVEVVPIPINVSRSTGSPGRVEIGVKAAFRSDHERNMRVLSFGAVTLAAVVGRATRVGGLVKRPSWA
jgi:hypothetical protein